MNLDLSEQQEMLKKMARDFLTNNCPKSLVRKMMTDEKGFTQDLWLKMADLGWMGLVVPEKYGGSDGKPLDLIILLQEAGRALLPAPLLSTVMLGALPIIQWGTEDQRNNFLPGIAKGNLIFTFAFLEENSKYEPLNINSSAVQDGDSYIVSGRKLYVPFAHVADWILCAMKSEIKGEKGITVFLVDSKSKGVTSKVLETINGEKLCQVTLEKVRVSKNNVLGQINGGDKIVEGILAAATVGQCAQVLGCVEYVLEMTVEYAKQRRQFGQPIGSFQTIQHQLANMVIDVDAIKLLTYQAAWKLGENMPSNREIALAKARASDGFLRIALAGLKIHGGVGYMEDHDMALYVRQAQMAANNFGDASYYRENIMRELACQI